MFNVKELRVIMDELLPQDQGGFGAVYKLGDRALKIIDTEIPERICQGWKHQNEIAALGYAPTIYDGKVFDAQKLAYCVMDWVDGKSLAEFSEDAIAPMLPAIEELCEVMDNCGLLHNDLHPGNVLWTPAGLKAIDFDHSIKIPNPGNYCDFCNLAFECWEDPQFFPEFV